MKKLKESILDADFDIEGPNTDFNGALELGELMAAENWQYFGVNNNFVYRSSKVKFSEMQEVIGYIIHGNKRSGNKCVVVSLRDRMYLSYPTKGKEWKICEICKQGNTGNIIISISRISLEFLIKQRTQPSYCKIPSGVVDLIEWCLTCVKK